MILAFATWHSRPSCIKIHESSHIRFPIKIPTKSHDVFIWSKSIFQDATPSGIGQHTFIHWFSTTSGESSSWLSIPFIVQSHGHWGPPGRVGLGDFDSNIQCAFAIPLSFASQITAAQNFPQTRSKRRNSSMFSVVAHGGDFWRRNSISSHLLCLRFQCGGVELPRHGFSRALSSFTDLSMWCDPYVFAWCFLQRWASVFSSVFPCRQRLFHSLRQGPPCRAAGWPGTSCTAALRDAIGNGESGGNASDSPFWIHRWYEFVEGNSVKKPSRHLCHQSLDPLQRYSELKVLEAGFVRSWSWDRFLLCFEKHSNLAPFAQGSELLDDQLQWWSNSYLPWCQEELLQTGQERLFQSGRENPTW